MSTEELEEHTEEMEELCSLFEKYLDRFHKNLKRKQEWVKLFRSEVIIRGHQTNNYAEASIRILKDIVLSRTKAFNVTAMVEFIVEVWERYFEAKLLHYAYGQRAAPRLKYEQLCDRMPESKFIIKGP